MNQLLYKILNLNFIYFYFFCKYSAVEHLSIQSIKMQVKYMLSNKFSNFTLPEQMINGSFMYNTTRKNKNRTKIGFVQECLNGILKLIDKGPYKKFQVENKLQLPRLPW